MELSDAFRQALADRYTVDRQIGQGGMAAVFLARDRKHERHVAIKVLKPAIAAALGAERFLEEIRVTAHLQHPQLLPLFDSGEADGLLYYVMPFVEGESLRARLEREGALPIPEAVRITKQVADGLDYAHRQGVVHRDLKPENILLTDGQPIVADFGVALAVSAAAATRMTDPGISVGTPQYMSPEQAAGERQVDARSDIYALGAMLYEMLAGRPPHAGQTSQAVLAKVLTELPASVRTHRDSVPAAIEAAVMRALARLPADRWATAADFGRALDEGGSRTPLPGTSSSAVGDLSPPHPGRQRFLVITALLGILLTGVAAWWLTSDVPPTASPSVSTTGPRALAVLPFENHSGDKTDEYFSDGLTEEVLHQLAQVPGLHVAARTSSFAFKGRQTDLADVAKRLSVQAVVSGSVRRSGDVLRITVQLVDVASGRPIWSESYQRNARDAFQVQDEIARAIVSRLGASSGGVATAPATVARPTGAPATVEPATSSPDTTAGPTPEAFDLYLQGRYQWNLRTPEGASAAISLLTRAVEQSPEYARAHAALAEAYAVMGFYDYLPPRVAFSKAREAARAAFARDPALAEAPNTLGYVALYHDWDLAAAEREFTRALALSPRYSVAHQWYANMLTAAQRFPEAIASMQKAQELDPLAPIPHAALGWVHLYARDFDAAERQLRRTLETHPRYFLAQLWLAEALEQRGQVDEALVAVEEALRISPGNPTADLARARMLARAGRTTDARTALARVQQRESTLYVPAYPRALVFIALGDREAAFALLNRAVADRAHSIALLATDPWLDPLRTDPRFKGLAAKARER